MDEDFRKFLDYHIKELNMIKYSMEACKPSYLKDDIEEKEEYFEKGLNQAQYLIDSHLSMIRDAIKELTDEDININQLHWN